ncbi:unnamed protein product, partial [Urochloa humidicola]
FRSFPFLIRCPCLAVYTRLPATPSSPRPLPPSSARCPLSADSELGQFGHSPTPRCRPLPPPPAANPSRAPAAPRSGEMEGAIVRRVIPSDNSCLFNAVGYVMEHNRNKASELRQVIAATVASDPVKFNEVFLGKPNEAYCAWILDPEKWGGAIELSILSEYYGREIAAYDIQTTRCDLYGQEKNYSERVMLIYDGLHYDALAMSPAEGTPEEFDQTIFPVNHNRSIGPAEGLALNLVKEAQRKRSYTDTANFTLRCGVCQIGVIGQKEAVEHAQATGHVNFQEYK